MALRLLYLRIQGALIHLIPDSSLINCSTRPDPNSDSENGLFVEQRTKKTTPLNITLCLVAHAISYRGVANVHRIKQDFIFSLVQLIPVQLKEGVLPLMYIQAMHKDAGFLLDQL